jgi:protein associated with RNAse G/E
MHPGQLISVFKLNLAGEETWRYAAKVLQVSDHAILLVAGFNRPERMFHGILLGQGDPFVEIYMNDRWYNIYEIHDKADGCIKGWYCNISLPAEFGDDSISYVDLALDLLVYPDGQMLVLDEDEFAELNLDETQQERARRALNELKGWFDQPVSLRLEKLDFLVCPLLRSPDQP